MKDTNYEIVDTKNGKQLLKNGEVISLTQTRMGNISYFESITNVNDVFFIFKLKGGEVSANYAFYLNSRKRFLSVKTACYPGKKIFPWFNYSKTGSVLSVQKNLNFNHVLEF